MGSGIKRNKKLAEGQRRAGKFPHRKKLQEQNLSVPHTPKVKWQRYCGKDPSKAAFISGRDKDYTQTFSLCQAAPVTANFSLPTPAQLSPCFSPDSSSAHLFPTQSHGKQLMGSGTACEGPVREARGSGALTGATTLCGN